MKELGDKVTVLYETEVREIIGTEHFEKIVMSKEFSGSTELSADGLFIEIGAKPDVALAQSLGVTLDDKGYIAVNPMTETNVPGVYAAGDAVNLFGAFKQTITATKRTGTSARYTGSQKRRPVPTS